MEKYKVSVDGKVYEVEIEKVGDFEPTVSKPVSSSGSGSALKAPIQGSVLSVLVKPGQSVSKGQAVMVIEAMKLENEIVADQDGVIDQVLVSEKQVVDNGQDLLTYRG
ncbi:biotin/lipoyl-binding protein [Erysipelothrix rhusiopathiae]|uniref:biotin/lipoyl-containing protein n=1 Tax=Erysipelothrix rhusiopathiae TaxID=1648 RepID=UPI000210B5C7|nr:biotin/lipoyl-containing protein [Erysipelothrix rhusiopathiae]AGN23959.1 acetyl-CoA carboxylase, biotin carboxyl carrier protein [Erysipelothrix rhusiopathiae SY1027]AMS11250.1 acetyl-CoA carboxylase biotin carboxyl carrier protein subunit [Erysipelothrix rhusiopathiae]AOO67748.1 acetyl-CoA carboxylase biotin carboxyl carrier protein subunit [Erysipelothrix rhusiopathiae]AWU41394.1 acetyl-CoA carboxylase biotin carboxyl carrier protein subunit [Erysipelothrix rhusiopathiae]MCG4457188.1 bio